MDSNPPYPPHGGFPNGARPGPSPAPPLSPRGPRNGSGVNPVPEPLRPSPAVTRAQIYDDEKKRIAATCFNKLDEQGKPLQSYITHIRVEEDAVYQSGPPPPSHPPHHKKPRVIIVSVKNNGRVSMHKARENEDSSFQIGKTWPLEELKAIESFSTLAQKSPDEEARAKWAGPTGFIITMTKPYYWQAKTAKEKDFFISSLVKIFNKYTEGQVPQLVGFDPRQRDEILASTKPPDGNQQPPQVDNLPPPLPSPARPFAKEQRPTSPAANSDFRSISVASTDSQRAPLSGPRPFKPTQQRPTPVQSPPPQPTEPLRQVTPQRSQNQSQESLSQQLSNQTQERLQPTNTRSPQPVTSKPLTSATFIPQASTTSSADYTNSPPTMPPMLSPKRQAERLPPQQAMNGDPFDSSSSRRPWQPAPLVTAPAGQSYTTSAPTAPNNLRSRATADPGSAPGETSQILPERRRPPLNDSEFGTGPEGLQPDSRPLQPSEQSLKADTYVPPAMSNESIISQPRPLTPSGQSAQDSYSVKSEQAPSAESQNGSRNFTQQSQEDTLQRETSSGFITPSSTTTEPQQELEPQFRPGLGPMIGKKADPAGKRAEVASKFRKAAAVHTAFKPRAGGAGDRLLGAQAKSTNEPDGITSVVPAKSAARDVKPDESKAASVESLSTSKRASATPRSETPSIQVVSAGPTEEPKTILAPEKVDDVTNTSSNALAQAQARRQRMARSPARPAKKTLSNPFESALSTLGIDTSVLKGRDVDYEEILNEFGWDRGFLQARKMDAFETDLKHEIDRLEAGSWLGHSDQKDQRVEEVEKLLDKTIAECEEMEGLLTLYSVELSTLTEDIAFIEAQSQGLQVQTANQKLLQTELQTLVDTISLDTGQLEPLRAASLNDMKGLASVERSLLLLYNALKTIDPISFSQEDSASSMTGSASNVTGMRALQERKESYVGETNTFLHRLRHYMDPTFGAAFQKTKDSFAGSNTTSRDLVQLHDMARVELWRFSPLMLFTKEVNKDVWQDILRAYQGRAREVYRDELREVVLEWKRRARKASTEEHEALFTTQEKESDSLTSTARKLTVKRSQTLARGLRQSSNEKRNALLQSRQNNQHPFETFTGVLIELLPMITTEQHFFVDFFHTTTLEGIDFPEAIAAEPPNQRYGTDLQAKRTLEPEREMSKRVTDAMDSIFASWQNEMQSLVDWAVKQDPFQSVGMLAAIERAVSEQTDTAQEYVVKTLSSFHDTLAALFTKFIDDQIRAIEATKVKIKKRRGVMAFVKVFPNFTAILENMLAPPNDNLMEKLEIRTNVDNAYERINKAMFSSLKQIAKEGHHATNGLTAPGSGSGLGVLSNADPEDKEALNHEILLIENMFYYYNEVDERSNSTVLGQWRGKAMLEMSEHQERYVNSVIRRPLGRLLDFIEGLEGITTASYADSKSIPIENPTYSRPALRKLLSSYDARECKRGIDALKKRIEKHFGEGSEDGLIKQKLMSQILGECERKYTSVFERLDKLVRDVYGGDMEVEFSKSDVSGAFKR